MPGILRISGRCGKALCFLVMACVLLGGGAVTSVYAESKPPSSNAVRVFLPVAINMPPGCQTVPCLFSPANDASVDTLLPQFTWYAGPADAISRLHVCPTAQVPCGSCYPDCPTVAGAGIHSVLPTENLPARRVWWAIELLYLDAAGQPKIEFSPARSLQVVGEPPVPQTPTLIGPSGTVTNTAVTFRWQPVTGALDYKLCYTGLKGWACSTTEAPELSVIFPAYEQRYVWWVEARNYYGYSGQEQMVVTVKPRAAGSAATRE